MKELSPKEFGRLMGVTPQVIRRYCNSGMPGVRRDGKHWLIDPKKARPWLEKHDNAKKIAGRKPVKLPKRVSASESPPAVEPVSAVARENDMLGTLISRLETVLNVLTVCIGEGSIDRNAVNILKQLSSEFRELVSLQRREKEADARLMDREDHRIIVETLARLVQQEGGTLPSRVPDAMLSSLSKAKIAVDNSKEALRVMQETMREHWEQTLGRMANYLRDALDGSTKRTR